MRQILRIFVILLCGYLGVYNGHLAIWQENATAPSEIIPRSVTIFPEKDRIALENGIPFFGQAERSHLLEDYAS